MSERRIPLRRASSRAGTHPARAKDTTPPARRDRADGRLRRILRPGILQLCIATLVVVAALFVFVFPTSALLDQKAEIREAEDRLELLERENRRLEREAQRLASDAEVERRARADFDMVRPGEQAWAVVPAPTTTTTTRPAAAPGAGTRTP